MLMRILDHFTLISVKIRIFFCIKYKAAQLVILWLWKDNEDSYSAKTFGVFFQNQREFSRTTV